MKGISIAGRKRFTEADLYETPAWATEALLEREYFDGSILEPACGYGAISEVLKGHGYEVTSNDKFEYGYGTGGIDFIDDYTRCENLVTNPPYNLASEFVQTAKITTKKKIAMFLKLSFLEGAKRYQMFTDTKFPLAKVYVFSSRVNLYAHGEPKPKNSGTIAFAWFVWDKSHVGEPVLKWIDDKEK